MLTTLVIVVIVIAVVGVGVYLLERYVTRDMPPIKIAIRVVAILGLLVWALRMFGIWGRY